MAWNGSHTFTVGEVLSAATLNTYLRDNVSYLHGDAGTITVASNLTATGNLESTVDIISDRYINVRGRHLNSGDTANQYTHLYDDGTNSFIDNADANNYAVGSGVVRRLYLNWGGAGDATSGVAVGNKWGNYGPIYASAFSVQTSTADTKRSITTVAPREALARVRHQPVVSFRYRHDAKDGPLRYGLIADDAHESFVERTTMPHPDDAAELGRWNQRRLAAGPDFDEEPPAIREVESTGLNLVSMVAMLFGAVQDLSERVEALEG